MSDNQQVVVAPGAGLGTLLFIVFLVLKLTGHITWSWWWVTVPLWGPLAILCGIFAIAVVLGLIAMIVKACIGD